jgi:hypothetical protein
MAKIDSRFTPKQLLIISSLKEVLKQMEELQIHISSVTEYEAVIFNDSDGKPYITIF